MQRTNAFNNSVTGTSSAVKIITEDPFREYICFYAVTGSCQIVIGDNDLAANAVTIPEGTMWEPKQVLTGNVWYKGSSTVLTVLY